MFCQNYKGMHGITPILNKSFPLISTCQSIMNTFFWIYLFSGIISSVLFEGKHLTNCHRSGFKQKVKLSISITSSREEALILSSIEKIWSEMVLTVLCLPRMNAIYLPSPSWGFIRPPFSQFSCMVATSRGSFKFIEIGPPREKFSSRLRSNVEDGDGGWLDSEERVTCRAPRDTINNLNDLWQIKSIKSMPILTNNF